MVRIIAIKPFDYAGAKVAPETTLDVSPLNAALLVRRGVARLAPRSVAPPAVAPPVIEPPAVEAPADTPTPEPDVEHTPDADEAKQPPRAARSYKRRDLTSE